jgi:Protein of unknown function (DUF2911)
MRRNFILSTTMLGAAIAVAVPCFAHRNQQQTPASPPAHAECKFADGATIHVDYSSPRMRGRTIFADDGLVPFGKVWRAGANEATTFVVSKDVHLGTAEGGINVPAGSYTLFTIPNKDKWTLIVSKKTGEWGIPYPGEQFDFARTEMAVKALPSPVEDFTIGFTPEGSDSCLMHMDWETTSAFVKIMEKK